MRRSVGCPICGERWSLILDIGAYLWQELEHRARALLAEVHTLARSYGWSEDALLSLSERRRHYYLELINHG